MLVVAVFLIGILTIHIMKSYGKKYLTAIRDYLLCTTETYMVIMLHFSKVTAQAMVVYTIRVATE